MEIKMKTIVAASILAVLVVGCAVTPIESPVVYTPGVVMEPDVVVEPGIVVEPAFVDVVVPGVWVMEGGRRVWHPPHNEHRPNSHYRGNSYHGSPSHGNPSHGNPSHGSPSHGSPVKSNQHHNQ